MIAGIAWIGASFYFIALDNHLEPPADPRDARRGVAGEVWELHGGGFYRVEKFRVAPERLPDPLHWFKWEAYTTWLSGFALLIVVFYVHASTYLVDPAVRDLTTWEAIVISIGGLALAWVVYDGLCRTFPNDEGVLAVLVFAFICVSAWGAGELFAGAGVIHPGRRDDRDDDGRQRLLRDHPGAARAGAGEEGRAGRPIRASASAARRGRCTTTT